MMTSLITDKKDLEEDYKDLSKLLSSIVDSTPMHMFVKDTGDDFRYVYSSPMMDQLYGRYHGEVTGKTDFELFTDSVTAQLFRDKDLEILRTGRKQRFVEQVIDPKGLLHTFDTLKMLVPRVRKSPYLLGLAWDITKQSEIEEQLHGYNKRLALSCQAGNIYPWTWDMITGTVELSLVKGGQIYHKSITHKLFMETIHPDDKELYENQTSAFVSGEIDSLRFSFRCKFFGDDYVWYEKVGEVYEYTPDGNPFKSIGILRDLTSDKRHEADVQAKLIAEESDRMKSAFIANMSHEIRTPLNAIVGFSTLMAQAESEEEKQEYLRIIETSNEFLLQLIGDILDISKIESGKMEFIYSTFRLRDIFAPQQQAFSLRSQPGVKVLFENPSDEDYYVTSEKTRLTQVLTNFLSNAIKFTSEGAIRFGYRVEGANEVYVYVTDTGTGIKSNQIETVFDRFVKLDKFKQGTGLGLSICKTIVNMLNGEIGVESKEDVGTTFWFRIPCTPIKV